LLAEFLPNSHRGRFLIYIEGFWTLGSIFVAGMAWMALSSEGWRVLTLCTAIPVCMSSFACVALLPESPRWLVTQGRDKEAAEVIRYAAAVNGFSLPDFRLDPNVEKEEHVPFSEFMKPSQIRLTIPLWIVWTCFGYV
jgi:MFS transporter, putative metabolite:H+ symporter